MNGVMGQFGAQIRAMSIPARAVILLAVNLLAAAAAAAYVYDPENSTPLFAVAIAAGICTAASVVALVLGLAWHGTPNGVVGALGGMLIGLGAPLASAVLVQRRDGDLAHAGFYGWIVVFYLVALTVKTLLVAPGYAPIDPCAPVDPYAPVDPTGEASPRGPGNPLGTAHKPSPSDAPNSPAKKSGV